MLTTLSYYRPHWTGLTRYAQGIAEGLVARGHDVTVLTSRHDPTLHRTERAAGVDIVRLPVAARVSRTMVMPRYPLELWRQLGRHDVLHVHTPMPEALLATVLARLRGVPTVVTHQGDVVMPKGAANRVVQAAMTITMGAALRLADAVTTLSEDYARRSRFLAPVAHKVTALHPPTTLPLPDPTRVAEWRTELGLGDAPVVGFAGRFVEEKGFDILLRAVPAVLAAEPTVRFLFAGETRVVYERFYERWAEEFRRHGAALQNVGLLAERQQMADFYALCDLFVLPSRSDCFGAVQVEALLSGTPLVAADIAGAREVVQRTGMGRLVPPDDPEALAAAIIDAVRWPLPRPERAAVEASFDPEASRDAHAALLAQVAAGRSGRTRHEAPAARPAGPAPAGSAPAGLTAADVALVERLTRNEADMAYRRRIPTLLGHLGLRDGDRLLDAGCGMGYLLMVASGLRNLGAAVGLDGDMDRLRWAQREVPGATLVQGDLGMLPFAADSFDAALLSEVLEHVDDDAAVLREARRVVRPGGAVAVSVPHANYPFWWDPINRTRETLGLAPLTSAGPITGQWSNHRRLYLPAELVEAATRAGLEVEVVEELTSRTFPFNHLVVYGVGKPLIERGLLPPAWRAAADRFGSAAEGSSAARTMGAARAVLRAVDRRNDRPSRGPRRRHVSLVARLRVPGEVVAP